MTKQAELKEAEEQPPATEEPQQPARPLTPLDYQQLLRPYDDNGPKVQPEADYWRKTDKQGHFVTGPIMRHQGVQKLARLFGVQIQRVNWLQRDAQKLQLTCEITVEGYSPLHDAQASAIVGRPVQLATDYAVPDETTGIGELNEANAGHVGKQFPQCLCYKRAHDRGALDHLGIPAYGDSEAPEFAQGADYEAEQERPRRESAPPSPDRELAVRCRDWPEDLVALAKKLVDAGVVDRPKIARIGMGCNWEIEDIRRVLDGLDVKAEAGKRFTGEQRTAEKAEGAENGKEE